MKNRNITEENNSSACGYILVKWVFISLFMLAPGSLYASDPFQFWLKGSLVAKASEHFRFNAQIMSKIDDSGDFFYEDNDFGVVYTGISHWLDLGAYYKTVFQKINLPGQEDVWQHEKRPHLNATARFKLFGLTFSDRIQLEYNSLEDLGDYGTFRNKIAINPPFYLEPKRERRIVKSSKVRPFASYEIFINSENGVSKHRFQGGASFSLSERVFCDLYYLRQENSNFDSGLNVAGLTLKLLF